MSMQEATPVDVDGGRVASRLQIDQPPTQRMMPDMQSVAAYYVIVASDLARESQTPRYQVAGRRRSLRARLATALSALVRPVRVTASSPA